MQLVLECELIRVAILIPNAYYSILWKKALLRLKLMCPYENKYWIQYFLREFPIFYREKNIGSNTYQYFFFHTGDEGG